MAIRLRCGHSIKPSGGKSRVWPSPGRIRCALVRATRGSRVACPKAAMIGCCKTSVSMQHQIPGCRPTISTSFTATTTAAHGVLAVDVERGQRAVVRVRQVRRLRVL